MSTIHDSCDRSDGRLRALYGGRRLLLGLALGVGLGTAALASAAPSPATSAQVPAATPAPSPARTSSTATAHSAAPAALPAPRPKGEAEFLIPPGGGAIDVPVHVSQICILSFPEKLVPKGIISSPDFEVQTWGPESVAVRAGPGATSATVALVTASGAVKINATIRVVPESEPAFTLVRLKPASEEEAFQARVEADVAKKLAPLQAQLAELRRGQDVRVQGLADQAATSGALQRSGVVQLDARERNDTHVILHVTKAVLLGETVYVLFDLENRGKAPFRIASLRVRSKRGGVELAASPFLEGAGSDPRVKALGVVPKKARVRGVAAVPFGELSRAGRFSLQVAEVDPRQSIQVGDLSL